MDLKIVQFHQYSVAQVQEVENFEDYDLLRRGGDGGAPQGDDDVYRPGPTIDSVHSDDDPTDIPVRDVDTDVDLDDEACWPLLLSLLMNAAVVESMAPLLVVP